MDIGAKIKKARQDAKLSQRELSRRSGVSQSLITRYEKGEVKNISHNHIEKIAAALEKPLSWFDDSGISPDEVSPLARLLDEIMRPPYTALSDKQARALMVFFREFKTRPETSSSRHPGLKDLTTKQKENELMNLGSHLQEAKIHRLPVLKVEQKAAAGAGDYIETPPEPLLLAQHRWKKGYKPFRITGNSMEPFIMNGDYVVVDLVRPPVDGDTVLARLNDGLVVKKFFRRKNTVELVSVNPDYAPIASGDIAILGVLVDIVRPLKKP